MASEETAPKMHMASANWVSRLYRELPVLFVCGVVGCDGGRVVEEDDAAPDGDVEDRLDDVVEADDQREEPQVVLVHFFELGFVLPRQEKLVGLEVQHEVGSEHRVLGDPRLPRRPLPPTQSLPPARAAPRPSARGSAPAASALSSRLAET